MLETDDGIVLSTFSLKDVVGRTIRCEDGIDRRVEQITYSQRYADKVLINEINEDETPGGAWVHALSLSCQMTGSKLPNDEQKKAFSRTMQAFQFVPEEAMPQPEYVKLPSGLVIKRK